MGWLKYLQLQFHCQEQTFVEESPWRSDVVIGNDDPIVFRRINLRNGKIDIVEFSAFAHRNDQGVDIVAALRNRVDYGFDVIFAAGDGDADNQDSQPRRLTEILPQPALSLA